MKKLRSQAWFGGQDKDGFIHRSWMKNNGLPDDAFDGRPIIGICNTFSDFTPCNAHFRELITHIKAGVLEAGGLPLEFPVFSCGESNLRPTAMLFRNLASMDVEEAIRANPMDGVVLMVGCDKTTPSLVMGAATCDLPTIAVSGGPMLNGLYRGKAIPTQIPTIASAVAIERLSFSHPAYSKRWESKLYCFASSHSSIPKLSPIFLGGVCVCDHQLGGCGWGVVVGLGKIGLLIEPCICKGNVRAS